MENDHKRSEGIKEQFSSDRAITSRQEDLLGRAGFADSMASAIRGWKGKESLVIALYGAWGSGKSSIKNMVLQSLRSDESESPLIVEFNPWQWTGQNQLAEAFFQEIGLVLSQSDKSEDGKQRAAKWRTYGIRFTLGAHLAKSLGVILPLLGLPGSGIADALAKVLEQSGVVAQEGSKGLEDKEAAHQQTLTEMKKELSDSLRKLEKPILVVIDDVDRLFPDEIKLLFQLVKANADFPNVVYLLLFQRDIVESSLDSPSIMGREFLKKIVQVGFDIPRIEQTRIEKLLFAKLNDIFGDEKVSKHFDQMRWHNLFYDGLRPYFQTLRDIYRYLSTLSFHVSLFRSTGSFEVNPLDLIALEVLRVFEPAVYQRLPNAKSELTDLQGRIGQPVTVEGQMKGAIASLINQASDETNRPQVREIVKQLFPPAKRVLDGPGHGTESEEKLFRELRVCHPNVFDRYFQLAIPEGDISQTDLERILALTGNRQGLVTEFRFLNNRGLLGVALDRLKAYTEKIELSHAVPFVTALFDIGDELPEEQDGFFGTSNDIHVWRIINQFLKQESSPEKHGAILKEAMRTSTGLWLPIMTAFLEGNEEKRKNGPNTFIVTDADLEALHQICVEKIEQATNAGTLATHPKMLRILYYWREWVSPEKPQQWVEGLITSREGVLFFLMSCVIKSFSEGGEHWRINLTSLEKFVSVDTLENKVTELSLDDISDREKKAVKAFWKAIKRRREGKSDDGWPDDDDE